MPLHLKNPFSSRRRIATWIFALVIFYAVFGFLILPPIVRVIAVKQLSRQLGREVSIGKVKINPFAFSATIRGFVIQEKDGQPFVSWDELYVNFKFWSLFGKTWVVQEISLTKPFAHLARNQNGTFNFSDILARFPARAAPAKPVAAKPLTLVVEKIRIADATVDLENRQPYAAMPQTANPPETVETSQSPPNILILRAVTNGFAALLDSTNQVGATLDDLQVTNTRLHFEDWANSRPAKLDLSAITFDARNISNLSVTNLTAQLSLRWNTKGAIKVDATASLQPATADIQLDLDQLDLGTLDPYLEPKLDLFILSSDVGLDGALRLRALPNRLPQLDFQGDFSLDNFHTVDGVMAEDLVKWGSVQFNGIDVNLNPEAVAVKQIVILNPYERLIIETNRTINLLNALRLTNSLVPAASQTKGVAAKSLVPANAAPRTNASVNEIAILPQISVGEIVISNEAADYTDRSLSPHVNLEIEQAGGTLSGISESQAAQIALHAVIEGIGVADITGSVNPFSSTATNQIKIVVKDVDLTPTSPYSGKFAGYGIAEGKLNLNLEYQLIGRKLDSKNLITLDQFTFGEEVHSPDATHLPVRLAIAILKDRQGKIILDVPVQGSLDDPKFRISKVIQRAIMNILEKVAASPFALLGAAFGGGGEELSYDEFAAGSAALTSADVKKLDVLATALYQRPGLQLEIAGSVDPQGDREGLQRAALDSQIRASIWMNLRKSDRATNSVEQIIVSPAERADWIERLYRQAVADGKITPELLAANTNLAAYAAEILPKKELKGAALLMASNAAKSQSETNFYHTLLVPAPDPMEAMLLATIPVDDNDFAMLAANRAKTVELYLLHTGKIGSSRLFLKQGTVQSLRRDGSRVYLQLQ
ncbi:MAG TPA: DUF748 domain-containing protein [Verrucomicrobiae bacterium]|nr:DUF748 domain-containing protein [Verrucomicrobiae bacterium]